MLPISVGGDRRCCSPCSPAAPAASGACSDRSWRCGSSRSALLGAAQIVQHPYVLLALSPTYAVELCHASTRWLAFFVLGAVVLCVTGAEALYADMGHFGATPDPR